MRVKTTEHKQKQLTKLKINVDTSATITDYQYNHNGTQLAVADSDGYVYIYQRNQDQFSKTASFKADQSAIWKLAWADPSFGDLLAIGSFKRKVAAFLFKNGSWSQIAYHQLHEGSVNHVEWASSAFGVKLYSAGSEGSVSILQLKKNQWISSNFYAHECSINSLAIRPLVLNESEEERGEYPIIATAAKDNNVRIWKHTSQIPEDKLEKNSRIYQQISFFKPHNESIRSILWKKQWSEQTPIVFELFTCSEDGSVKLTRINEDNSHSQKICEFDNPVFRIAQSLTGNLLTVSVASESQSSYLYQEGEPWKLVDELK